ncbi:MAG TPA: nuclear transport factor 2 family protein [Solirubrobacteraceae bacterium]|nr:nuclear transport factor 2 family protein [Solirubrobacteraceae bacterium]
MGVPLTRVQAVALAEQYVRSYNDRNLEGMLEVLDQNVVSHPSRLAGASPHNGHEGVRAWWASMAARGDWYEVAIREIRQPDPDRVVILGDVGQDGQWISPWCVVVKVRNGLIVESHSYLSDEGLLDQLGLIGPSEPSAEYE